MRIKASRINATSDDTLPTPCPGQGHAPTPAIDSVQRAVIASGTTTTDGFVVKLTFPALTGAGLAAPR